jgi:NAD+ diphosphatase
MAIGPGLIRGVIAPLGPPKQWTTGMLEQTGPGFIHNQIDRMHPSREDAGWIAAQRARPEARIVVVAGEQPVYGTAPGPGPTALLSPQTAEALAPGAEEMFLGIDRQGRPVFARMAAVLGEGTTPEGIAHGDLRALALGGELPQAEVALLALAKSMLLWHQSHRFCSRCGAPSDMALGGFRRDCPSCGAQHFPRTDPVVISLVTDGDRALIARSARFVAGMYSALAGFVEPGETIEQAVRREIAEEVGVAVGRIAYHSSQPWPYPSSLMIGCFGEAASHEISIDPAEIEHAMWVTREDIAAALAGTGTFRAPQPVAIAHHLFRAYAQSREPVFSG